MSHKQFSLTSKTRVDDSYRAEHSTLPRPSVFVLHQNCTEELKLIRLLLGNIKVEHANGDIFIQGKDFSKMGAPRNGRSSKSSIREQLAAFAIDAGDVEKLLRSTLSQRGYYGELLAEALQYFQRSKSGEHTLAFLHCYRFLEHIAFAFPMLYASRSSNFKNAFASLKDFFAGGPGAGELKFLEKFVETSIERNIREQSVEISINGVGAQFSAGVYTAIKRQLDANAIISEVPNQKIEVHAYVLTLACINMRNRFFHFRATDASNISLNDVGDSDAMFACVNEAVFNWLAVIYFETLKHRVNTVS